MPTTPAHRRSGVRADGAVAPRTGRPFLKCFPVEDRAFVGAVRRWLDEGPGPAAGSAANLESRLRRDYPAVRVVTREVLAEAASPTDPAETEEVWFIFRDGTPARAPLEFE